MLSPWLVVRLAITVVLVIPVGLDSLVLGIVEIVRPHDYLVTTFTDILPASIGLLGYLALGSDVTGVL